MRKIPLLLMILSVLAITSCSIIDSEIDTIQIRIENVSDVDMENLTLNEVNFGTVKAGKTSDYQTFEYFTVQGDFIMAYYSSEINGQTVDNKLDCFFCGTGAEDLKPGKYTIEVDYEAVEEYSSLNLKFK